METTYFDVIFYLNRICRVCLFAQLDARKEINSINFYAAVYLYFFILTDTAPKQSGYFTSGAGNATSKILAEMKNCFI